MYEIVKTLEKQHFTKGGRAMPIVMVRCQQCGETKEVLEQNVMRSNRLKRAHCAACIKHRYHHMTGTRPYRIWKGARERFENPKSPDWQYYGGRGIRMCQAWSKSFAAFWHDMGPSYSDDLTIEGINVNGHYSPDNCRWAPNMEQQANKRNNRVVNYQGDTMHLAEFARRSGFSKIVLTKRLNRGMTGDATVKSAFSSTYGKSRNARSRRVYDLIACGPRHQFLIRNADGETFISHNSAGHGLNLQHGGSRMAWLSPSWSAELTQQAIARIYRPGQTRHTTIHVCVAAGTVDEMKRDRVIGKMSAQEAFRRHLSK
jgi:hypothetical protein